MYGLIVFAFLLSAALCMSVAAWLVLRNEPRQPGFTFGLFMLVMGWWSATHVGTLTSNSPGGLLLFTQLSYLSAATIPVVWLVFALDYTDRGKLLSRRRIALLMVIPLLTLGLVFTAQYHELYYSSMSVVDVGGWMVLATEPGPWHVVNIAYSYTLLMVGTGVLVKSALANNHRYRRQAAILLGCSLTPWVVNAAYHLGVRPIRGVDPTPLAFTIVGIPLALLIVQTDLQASLPVAYERVFQTLDGPVLVVDPNEYVLDANTSARSVFAGGCPLEGTPATELLPAPFIEDGALQSDVDGPVVCSLEAGGESRQYLTRRWDIDPDWDTGSRGTIVSLTDITVQMNQRDTLAQKNETLEAQTEKLELKNEQLERLAGVISHDLATPLATGETLVRLIRADIEDSNPELERSVEDLETVHERLREFAQTLPQLARESIDVESSIDCDIADVATSAWDVIDTASLTLTVGSTRTVEADPRRLQQAFENLFQNTVEHGSPTRAADASTGDQCSPTQNPIADTHGSNEATENTRDHGPGPPPDSGATTIRIGMLQSSDRSGFYVEDDGPGIPPERRDNVLSFGASTGPGSGYGLAIVRTIVEAHGWSLAVTCSPRGGVRFEVDGVK